MEKELSRNALSPDVPHVTVPHLGYRTLDLLHCSIEQRNIQGHSPLVVKTLLQPDRTPPRRVGLVEQGKVGLC